MPADHALAFLGVERSRYWPRDASVFYPIPRVRVLSSPASFAWVACSCGWTDSKRVDMRTRHGRRTVAVNLPDDHARHAVAARRNAEEAAITDAACLYCFAPLEKPGYCSEQHRLADRVRVPGDIREGVLDEFREAPVASPDQMEMW